MKTRVAKTAHTVGTSITKVTAEDNAPVSQSQSGYHLTLKGQQLTQSLCKKGSSAAVLTMLQLTLHVVEFKFSIA